MNAISVVDGVMELDKELCNNCGLCVEKCPFDVIPEGNRGYKVTVGGRWGKIGERGKPLSKLVRTEEELNDIVEKPSCCIASKASPAKDWDKPSSAWAWTISMSNCSAMSLWKENKKLSMQNCTQKVAQPAKVP